MRLSTWPRTIAWNALVIATVVLFLIGVWQVMFGMWQ